MALTLRAVLDHTAFSHSGAEVVAGDPARGTVRWVHSTDIYDVAPLLRGGELLLTTGLGLADRTPEERRAYVRALAARDVAGLALELAGPFTAVPEEMVQEAARTGLCLVALPRVYPFVEVSEQVNSAILESSVVRLQHRDEVGRTLSRVLADRGGLEGLTRSLAELLGCAVVLTDTQGEVLLAAGDDPQRALDEPRASAAVTADGLLLGGLVVGPGDAHEELLAAALDRSPEFFALEALRTREGTLLPALERRALLRRLRDGVAAGAEVLAGHVPAARTRPGTPWVGLAVEGATDTGLGTVDLLARRAGVDALAAELDGTVVALLAGSAGVPRGELALRLTAAAPAGARLAVGPVVEVEGVGRSLRAACQALTLSSGSGSGSGSCPGPRLVSSADVVVERLLAEVRDPLVLTDLVEEQLGDLLRAPGGESLVRTVEEYLASGCSKAATARALRLRRQSVHQRLDRVNARLGYDVTAPERRTALQLALAARAVLAAGSG